MDAVAALCRADDVNALQAYLDGEKSPLALLSLRLLVFPAAEADTPRCLKLLLASGRVDVNRLCHPRNCRCLLSVAAENAHSIECVTTLLQAGADPDFCDDTSLAPLHYAARSLRPASVRALLTAGAKVDQTNIDGCTALYFAVRTCSVSAPSAAADGVVQLLLDAGADMHRLAKNGQSPLHQAVGDAKTPRSVLRLLIAAAGGDVDRGFGLGWTPLMNAVSSNCAVAFAELVEAGADLHGCTCYGCSAIQCATDTAWRDGTRYVRDLVRRGVEIP